MPWDPARYRRFGAERLRPGLDLLARVDHPQPGLVVDLGCGTGELTALLARRWPQAQVMGVDSSPQMLEAAPQHPNIRWVEADLASWAPPAPPDVVVCNAVLHWVDDHDVLLPQLVELLAPGGVLALQMPRNFSAASHRAIRQVAGEAPWAEKLQPLLRPEPVASPSQYHRLLAPLCRVLDIWETTYLHRLTGPHPVLEWVTGTALRPLLAALSPPEQAELIHRLRDQLAQRYPPEPDGTTLFPFRRLFIVAAR